MDEKYDGLLMSILQNERKLDGFLDAIFSFLRRRTDFYHILTEEKQNMGFPPGMAFQMVVNSFKKFEAANLTTVPSIPAVPQSTNRAVDAKPACKSPKRERNDLAKDLSDVKDEEKSVAKPKTVSNVNDASKGKDSQKESESYEAPPETYNGADCDLFTWSQTITDLDMRVQVPSHVKSGKNVEVIIKRKQIKIRIRDKESGDFSTLLDDIFTWDVNCEESMWSFVPSDSQIHINLEKARERWWERVLTGDKIAVDVRKIDCSRPLTDLDEESQTKIQQLMYDQRQKQMGLPTSEQQNMTKMLEKAWNAEGSPFRGQEFDPSRVVMGSDGSATIK